MYFYLNALSNTQEIIILTISLVRIKLIFLLINKIIFTKLASLNNV
jgi:hypothetical protein